MLLLLMALFLEISKRKDYIITINIIALLYNLLLNFEFLIAKYTNDYNVYC